MDRHSEASQSHPGEVTGDARGVALTPRKKILNGALTSSGAIGCDNNTMQNL